MSAGTAQGPTGALDPAALRSRVAAHLREHALLAPGEPIAALVSGGASTTRAPSTSRQKRASAADSSPRRW